MSGSLQKLADFSVLTFVVSTMLAMGMSQPLAEVLAPLKKPWPVIRAVLINFAVAPLLAIVLARIIPLQPAHASGLLLLGAAAGAPFLPKLAAISRGNAAYSVALMLLLMGGSLIFMPLAVPLMGHGASVNPWEVARPLICFMMIPLTAGFALALCGFTWTTRLLSAVRALSGASFVVLIVLMVGLNAATIVSAVGSFAIGTYAFYLLLLAGIGYFAGAVDRDTQKVFALGAASRNLPAALVVAGSGPDNEAVAAALAVAFVVSLVVLLVLARAMRPREQELRAGNARGADIPMVE